MKMENNEHHRFFRVRNTDRTQSENLHPCDHQHSWRQRKHLTSKQREDAQRSQIFDSYDPRKDWCEQVKRRILSAKNTLKGCEQFKQRISGNIDKVENKLNQKLKQVAQLKKEKIKLKEKLQEEADKVMKKIFNIEFQAITSQLQSAQQELQDLKKEIESLYHNLNRTMAQINKLTELSATTFTLSKKILMLLQKIKYRSIILSLTLDIKNIRSRGYLQIQENFVFFLTYLPLFYLSGAPHAAQLFYFPIFVVSMFSMWLTLPFIILFTPRIFLVFSFETKRSFWSRG